MPELPSALSTRKSRSRTGDHVSGRSGSRMRRVASGARGRPHPQILSAARGRPAPTREDLAPARSGLFRGDSLPLILLKSGRHQWGKLRSATDAGNEFRDLIYVTILQPTIEALSKGIMVLDGHQSSRSGDFVSIMSGCHSPKASALRRKSSINFPYVSHCQKAGKQRRADTRLKALARMNNVRSK
jgi:hypothetical protein